MPDGRQQVNHATAHFVVERTGNRRFPFRVSVEQGGRLVVAVRAQAAWPGPGQQVFCLREAGFDPVEHLELVERVPVAHLSTVGRKVTLRLDRPTRKRCEFLTVRKTTKDGRLFEQVFFRTEAGIRAHRSRTRVELKPRAAAPPLVVAIDTAERYPWRFPGATALRRKLPVGDYGLLADGRVTAVVERKTFDNLLSDIGAVQAWHHHLADLAAQPRPALVIEAQYADFLDDRRLAGRWPAAHVGRVLAEVQALHPALPMVFAGNRKLANQWCARFFEACATRDDDPQLELVREAAARYAPAAATVDDRVRAAVRARGDQPFALVELCKALPDIAKPRVRRVLGYLEAEGVLERTGRGRGTRWRARSPTMA